MKLIIVLLTTIFLQISLASEAQKVTLSEKRISLETAFKKIRAQTGYDFFCDIELLEAAQKISINVKNLDLEETLKYCLSNQNLTYIISDKIIVIRKATELQREKGNILFDIDLSGKIIDENGQPLLGATITIKRTKKNYASDKTGKFSLKVEATDILLISYVGFETKEVKVSDSTLGTPFIIILKMVPAVLKQVEVVSTGYQDLPKERTTGSFQAITAKQLEHSTDPNLLKRLEGITTGLDFNNNIFQLPTNSSKFKVSPIAALTIRGKNNLQSAPSSDPNQTSGQPLVVIDGIASSYSLDKINPNDVESVNILQDASASSVWGSRAANGVIVVKTKRGSYETPISILFNTNVAITDKMDLFYKKLMSTSDFIDAQLTQLNYNFSIDGKTIADPTLSQPQELISPVAEIWNLWKKNRITTTEYNRQLDLLRKNDVRNDLNNYFLRNAITQNYSLGISGGTNKYAYYLSGSYDKSKNNTINSDANRTSINYNNSIKILKGLELRTIINYNQQNRIEQAGGNSFTGESLYPYTRLVDDQGNPQIIPRTYRPPLLELLNKSYGNKILDMTFNPLDDINQGYSKIKAQLFSLNTTLSYKFNSIISGNFSYSNVWGQDEQNELRGEKSYFMRELINKFTDPSTFVKAIPLGGLYLPAISKYNNQTLRGLLNMDKTWAERHDLTAIIGLDVSENYSNSRSSWFYGYDDRTLTVKNNLPFGVLKNTLFKDPSTGISTELIPYISGFSDSKIRSFSFYSNAAYTYDKRYTLSASIRNDFSSIFGQGTNKRGASYFSLGGRWNISNEKFYHINWLPNLQLRTTFGYNGNVNTNVSPIPLINYTATSFVGNMFPYASTNDGSNPQLRPEKASMLNMALNFSTKNNRLSGSIEYYIRKTTDLISLTSLDPSSGFNRLAYNAADLRGTGTDIFLNSINLQKRKFNWSSNLLFSNNRVKVTKLFTDKVNTAGQQIYGTPKYNQGSELSRLFAFRWAGLDPITGDPMGYIDGKIVTVTGEATAFNSIADAPSSTAHYFGSSVPVYFGSFRNTLNYNSFSVSINFLYKLAYYFRRPPSDLVRYSTLLNDNIAQSSDYSKRWQKPGDEKTTNVPSLILPITTGGITEIRDLFYQYSDINVEKADHIRLQEINLSYNFKPNNGMIKNLRIYANVNNLGIIWRANKLGLDPDIYDFPQPKTYSAGLTASF